MAQIFRFHLFLFPFFFFFISSSWTSFRGKLWSMCIGLPGICGHHVEWHEFPFCHFFFPPPSLPCLSGHGLQVSQGESFITSSYTAELTVGWLRSSSSESDPANLRSCLHRYSNNNCPARSVLNPKSTTPALYKLGRFAGGCQKLVFGHWFLESVIFKAFVWWW